MLIFNIVNSSRGGGRERDDMGQEESFGGGEKAEVVERVASGQAGEG